MTARCPYARSDMTPCYLRDGDMCIVEIRGTPNCVGCERSIASLSKYQGQDDANLIGAASDLLEALKAMVNRWEPDTTGADRRMWEDACEAIRKAEGRP